MIVTFFDAATGAMRGHWSGPKGLLAANMPAGCDCVIGHHELYAARIDVAQLSAERAEHAAKLAAGELPKDAPFVPSAAVVVAQRPPAPSADHEWNAERQRWQLSAAASKRQVALAQIDLLERAQPRALREAVLGLADGRERLQAVETQIAALRSELTR